MGQPPSEALIGQGGVRESVAKDDQPPSEGRPDDLGHMVPASDLIKEELGTGGHPGVLSVEEFPPDMVGQRGPARFPSTHEAPTLGDQPILQDLDLSRLSRPFNPFKSDKKAFFGVFLTHSVNE